MNQSINKSKFTAELGFLSSRGSVKQERKRWERLVWFSHYLQTDIRLHFVNKTVRCTSKIHKCPIRFSNITNNTHYFLTVILWLIIHYFHKSLSSRLRRYINYLLTYLLTYLPVISDTRALGHQALCACSLAVRNILPVFYARWAPHIKQLHFHVLPMFIQLAVGHKM